MLLEHKNAVIYGAGGAIGAAVARAFAREGATVHLAGRNWRALIVVRDEITESGGHAEVGEVDALDGLMGRVADAAGIHFKLLNRS